MRRSTYRITATTAEGRFLATAVRNLWGWHVSTSRRGEVLTWASCDTTADALRAVHDVAALRLASRSN